MPIFIYEALHENGQLMRGEMEIISQAALMDHLSKNGLTPLKVAEKGKIKAHSLSLSLFAKVSPQDQILLVRNLAASTRAGMSIVEALDILIADSRKKLLREILITAKNNIQNGQPLSATFDFYKQYFPPIFIGLIKAGEASGKLDQSLDELAKQITKDYNLKRKIQSALAYPLILLVASTGAIVLLVSFILPKLANTFRQSGVQLPLITRIFVQIGAVIAYSWTLDIVILFFLAYFFIYFRKTHLGQRLTNFILFNIPVVRELVKKAALIRFTRSLGNLIQSGIVITEDLALAAQSVGNERYQKAILKARDKIITGVALSKTFEEAPDLFPRFLISLMAVGEKTGTLEQVLKTFADFYEDDLDNTLKDVSTFLEPILLLLMGLVIGSIAFSILLPIYQLVGKFT